MNDPRIRNTGCSRPITSISEFGPGPLLVEPDIRLTGFLRDDDLIGHMARREETIAGAAR